MWLIPLAILDLLGNTETPTNFYYIDFRHRIDEIKKENPIWFSCRRRVGKAGGVSYN